MLQPERATERTVRQEPMIAEVDAKRSEEVEAGYDPRQSRPTE
jgi:hypothetical protein